ncbi:MAG: general secretion pathway protein GspF [Gammaproteobacteria bacterium]|nr:general secretion pathway protein GspF [Gammaproteobacteria bacterium]
MRAKTAEAYVRLVDQAIIEIEEFIACLEFDMDDPGDQLRVLTPLFDELKQLRQGMSDGSYEFEDKDLPFMNVANRLSSQLPFAQLLVAINQTHRYGLNIDSEE